MQATVKALKMKNSRNNNFSTIILKRTIALFIAVVFVFGTIYMPAGAYAADVTGNGAAANTAGAEQNQDPTAEQTTETKSIEQAQPDEQEMPAADGTVSDMEELLILPEKKGIEDIEDLDEDEYNGFIYKLEDDITKTEVREMEGEIDELGKNREVEEVVSNEVYVADSVETIDEVATTEIVEYIEPNYRMTMTATPNDPYYGGYGWSLKMLNVPTVWDKNMFGENELGVGVTVAVLDTGVPDHVDIDSTRFVHSENYSVEESSQDVVGHATGVIGTIAAKYNNGRGMTGAMPKVSIMPIKVLGDDGGGYTSDVVSGIYHAIKYDADVINMSLGGPGSDYTLRQACDAATAAGIIVVAASGNEANDYYNGQRNPVIYPAAYSNVISVAAVDSSKQHAYFSTYNSQVTVAAPGESVFLPAPNGGYYLGDGTSFSAPLVAALAAMAKSIDGNINTGSFNEILSTTSKDLGATGKDAYYGYGLADFASVYSYMTGDIDTMGVYLSSTAYTYNGGVKTPSVVVKQGNKTLVQGQDYSVSYSDGRQGVGSYAVTVSAISKSEESATAEGVSAYSGAKTVKFTINPPLAKGLKSPTRGKKKLKVRWYSMSKSQKAAYRYQISGYQVRVSLNRSFSGAKYGSVSGYTKTSKTIKGLKKKKTYYVQYRSYKTVGGVNYYSGWSAVKAKKTK